jgi:hypothetical protein
MKRHSLAWLDHLVEISVDFEPEITVGAHRRLWQVA